MDTLHIIESKDSPEVYFGPDINVFQVSGLSLPGNPIEFYAPIFQWMHDYLYSSEINSSINIDFKLNYFNTASMKLLAKFFRIIDNSPAKDNVSINWYYDEEDTDMLDSGKRFAQFCKLKFNYITNPIEEE